MNKKIIIGILLIALIGSIGAVMAVNDGENVTYNHYGNGSYVFNDSNNDTVYGYCLNQTKSSPSVGSNMSVSNDTSSVDNRIKELIVTYYRGDSSEQLNNNVAIRTAIWNITNNQNSNGNSLATSMLNNLTGVSIGNTYTFSDGVYNYVFNFFMGKASSSSTQPMILFTFFSELIPEEPPEEPIIENETNETNTTINETVIKTPELPNKTNISNNITVTNYGNINTTNPVFNITGEIILDLENVTNTNNAKMKNTGNNLIILALAIIGIIAISVIIRKRCS